MATTLLSLVILMDCFQGQLYDIDVPELSRAITTACLTLAGGVVLLVVTQVFEKFVISPLDRFHRTLGEITFNMIQYANIYTNPGVNARDEADEASKKLHQSAAQLLSDNRAVNGYNLLARIGMIPTKEQVQRAANLLIFLSNSVYSGNPTEIDGARKEVSTLLRLDIF